MDKNNNYYINHIKDYFKTCGFEITDTQASQFYRFYELLVSWNEKMNLTGITDFDEVLRKHFLDSVILKKVGENVLKKDSKIIDIGTGAGFPGIPLKIMFPELRLVLLDSLGKRIDFLNCVINELGLKDIEAVHGRAEEFVSQGNREQFDLCVSRAVADLRILSEFCIPFVKPGGYFIPYKSGDYEEELALAENSVSILGGKIEDTIQFVLEGGNEERSLIIIRKIESTSEKYPRRFARIMKNPL